MPRPSRSNPKTRTHAIELRKEPTSADANYGDSSATTSYESTLEGTPAPVGRCRGHAVGNYIPDFVCIEKKLIIELDGSQHLEREEYDEERTKYLNSLGYKVIRFWNNDVTNNIDGVILAIIHAMEDETNKE